MRNVFVGDQIVRFTKTTFKVIKSVRYYFIIILYLIVDRVGGFYVSYEFYVVLDVHMSIYVAFLAVVMI